MRVVQHPDTGKRSPPQDGNSKGLNHRGLWVDNMEKALSLLPDCVGRQGDPVGSPLPGTKIGGVYVAFMRSPDGVMFEFVEWLL